MRQAVWVVGAGGLLGSALVRALGRVDGALLHAVEQRLAWGRNDLLAAQLDREVQAFARAAERAGRWLLVWAAGVGSMSSDAASLGLEAQALDLLLERLAADLALRATPGCLVLASSAGAIYGQSSEDVISESSAAAPGTAYAAHKLRLEAKVCLAIEAQPGWAALLARYSTLYGTGQSRDKAQGLISQLARRIVANEVVHIYVPLDTIRDYIFADDAADRTLAAVHDLWDRAGEVVLKIIAAEQAVSIAQLVGVFRRVSRRPVRLVTSVNNLSPLYVRCIRFRSDEPAGQPHASGRCLHIGIHQVLEAERTASFHRQH
ncbi:NAD-dependent epimerase/dehydratase family protein [Roseateles sp. LYH14W]|uniref:NAD-dependent epimerase/dehydratase family protein n=1 Tax=Pelomonas parva TaxID=3299032 RepID=A0ABW7EVU9_9BURK